jgi:hypothetical protein
MQASIIAALVFVLAFGVLQAALGGVAVAANPGPMPNVGWNTKGIGLSLGGDAEPSVGWNGRGVAYTLPAVKPCVGWNS